MYAKGENAHAGSTNILDRWILARLYETIQEVGSGLEQYLIDKGARPLFDFVDDLSTWYVRRSRDRFKGEGEDKANALSTTRFVLKEFAKVSAPFIPFVSEEVYQMVKEDNDPESVHLCDWSKVSSVDKELLKSMKLTRDLASQGLLLRQKSGVKVRQPLQSFSVIENLSIEYFEILKDEINVKEVLIGKEISLDTNITEELKREGQYRELLRAIQDLRKKKDLSPKQTIKLVVGGGAKGLVETFQTDLKRLAQISEFIFEEGEGEIVDLEDYKITISIR
jgi:isoleucyl-tRNA synthetase